MVTRAKKRRQQRAQSRLVLCSSQAAAAQRAEHQWHKILRQLAALGATLQEDGVSTDGIGHPAYTVDFEGSTYRCGSRLHIQRRLQRTQRRLEEQNMSWAERHVQWMIEHNCEDFDNQWPE